MELDLLAMAEYPTPSRGGFYLSTQTDVLSPYFPQVYDGASIGGAALGVHSSIPRRALEAGGARSRFPWRVTEIVSVSHYIYFHLFQYIFMYGRCIILLRYHGYLFFSFLYVPSMGSGLRGC